MSNPIVVFHGACPDGFCAAWVCSNVPALKEAEFFPGFFGKDPPDVTNRDVVMVDFSYPRPVLEKMADSCASMLILDHHKTAQEALVGFSHPKVHVEFDMNRSGAGMAWDNFNPGVARPPLVSYVEDRDLWKKVLPNSEEVCGWISTLPYEFEAWNEASSMSVNAAAHLGKMVLAKTKQYVREVSKNARRISFHGYDVPLVNAPQVDISELLDTLRQGEIFAMGWWQRADGIFQYSLRSVGDFDVSKLAKDHGGGGHKNAAGFQSKDFIF